MGSPMEGSPMEGSPMEGSPMDSPAPRRAHAAASRRRPRESRVAMALVYAAKASRCIFAGRTAQSERLSLWGAKIGLFAEARYRGKTGAVASPVPAHGNGLGQARSSRTAFAA